MKTASITLFLTSSYMTAFICKVFFKFNIFYKIILDKINNKYILNIGGNDTIKKRKGRHENRKL
jgi:hypothetical protein